EQVVRVFAHFTRKTVELSSPKAQPKRVQTTYTDSAATESEWSTAIHGFSLKPPPAEVHCSATTTLDRSQQSGSVPPLQAAEKRPTADPARRDRKRVMPFGLLSAASKWVEARKKLPVLSTATAGSPCEGTETPSRVTAGSCPSLATVAPPSVETDQ